MNKLQLVNDLLKDIDTSIEYEYMKMPLFFVDTEKYSKSNAYLVYSNEVKNSLSDGVKEKGCIVPLASDSSNNVYIYEEENNRVGVLYHDAEYVGGTFNDRFVWLDEKEAFFNSIKPVNITYDRDKALSEISIDNVFSSL